MIGDRVRVLKEHKDGTLDGQLGINTPHAAAFKVLLQERILLSWKKINLIHNGFWVLSVRSSIL